MNYGAYGFPYNSISGRQNRISQLLCSVQFDRVRHLANAVDIDIVAPPTECNVNWGLRLLYSVSYSMHVAKKPLNLFFGIYIGFRLHGYDFSPNGLKRPCRDDNGVTRNDL